MESTLLGETRLLGAQGHIFEETWHSKLLGASLTREEIAELKKAQAPVEEVLPPVDEHLLDSSRPSKLKIGNQQPMPPHSNKTILGIDCRPGHAFGCSS